MTSPGKSPDSACIRNLGEASSARMPEYEHDVIASTAGDSTEARTGAEKKTDLTRWQPPALP